MKPTLGVYMFLRNGEYYDYPWREAIESALPIANEIIVCECYSDKDDTWEQLQRVDAKYPTVQLIRSPWVTDFQGLSGIGNYCIPRLSTTWHWQLQADEVIHEDSYSEIRSRIELAKREDVTAFLVHYTHLLANYETEFDFCYQDLVRIARRGSPWWLAGDACQLTGGDPRTVVDTQIRVFHYGKVHEGHVGFQKEVDFQNLFRDIGFPDPKMAEMKEKLGEAFCDYVYLFEAAIREGKVKPFTGTHPKVMEERIARFKSGGWEQFESVVRKGLSLRSLSR